jgi:hypothetical protein
MKLKKTMPRFSNEKVLFVMTSPSLQCEETYPRFGRLAKGDKKRRRQRATGIQRLKTKLRHGSDVNFKAPTGAI